MAFHAGPLGDVHLRDLVGLDDGAELLLLLRVGLGEVCGEFVKAFERSIHFPRRFRKKLVHATGAFGARPARLGQERLIGAGKEISK